jgi:hypothetical protein
MDGVTFLLGLFGTMLAAAAITALLAATHRRGGLR